MESNIRASEGMEVTEDTTLPEGELRIKQVIAQSVDGQEASVYEHMGIALVSALLDKEDKGFHVMLIGDMNQQVSAVNAIISGVVGRIMSYDEPMHRIMLMTGLSKAIADALMDFDPIV